jgi:son of sevenless-like protein
MIQFKMLGINFVFSGVFLSDLTMIEEGNPDLIQDLINFKKRDMIYQVIEKVLRYQQDAYNFQCTDEKALNAFVTLPHMKEQLLYNKSLEIEPRGVENKRDLLKLESKSKRDLFA